MKIASIDVFPVPPRWLFVRVTTDDGLTAWGEATLEGWSEAVQGAIGALSERLVGHDPHSVEDAWQIGFRGGFYRGGPVLMSAMSGIDQALWDIKGRSLGVPAWQLLGGRVRSDVRAYGWIGGDRPSDVVRSAREMRERGFGAVKMNGTAELGRLAERRDIDGVLERVAAVRETGLEVAVDFHGRVHRTAAKALLHELEAVGPMFVEEPVLSEHKEALRDVKGSTTIPIALGERVYGRWGAKEFLLDGTVDILQPDLAHAGGLSEVRKIAMMAEAFDVAIAPHCPIGPIALAASLQLAACTPNVVLQEMSLGIHYNGDDDLFRYVKDPAVLRPDQGRLAIPEGPGLGIEIDEAAVIEASQEWSPWRNPLWRLRDGTVAEW